MAYFKTISSSNRDTIQQTICKKIIDDSTNRNTIQEGPPLMSTNKSIIYIKLPKKNQNLINNFRSSLYQSSIKRLKQLQSSHQKETHAPTIKVKQKNFQQFQQTILRKYRAQKQLSKSGLPTLNSPFNKMPLNKHNYTIFLQEQSIEQEAQLKERSRELTQNADKKILLFDSDDSIFGYKNLKQKYLKQSSLSNKKRIQSMQKYQSRNSRNSLIDKTQQDEINNRYKMNKQVEQHMNRYNQKDLFQHRLNGIKTNLYPQQQNKKSLRLQEEPIFQSQFSNFVKRKKLKSIAWTHLERSQRKRKHLPTNQSKDLKFNHHQENKTMDCTPWDTDVNYD